MRWAGWDEGAVAPETEVAEGAAGLPVMPWESSRAELVSGTKAGSR